MMTRRNLMFAAAAAPAAGSAMAAAPRNIVISSDNGIRACARAMERLASGSDTLDAVVAGVNINEEDPEDSSVGYGGLPNEEGVVELDAFEDREIGDGRVRPHHARRRGSAAVRQGLRVCRRESAHREVAPGLAGVEA